MEKVSRDDTPHEQRMVAVVIGGGITGLAAARKVAMLLPLARVVLIERDGRVGGKAQTIHDDGFTVEAGPDSYLASKPWMTDLCGEIGLGDQLQATRPENRGSLVFWSGALHPLPEGLSGLIPTKLGPVFRSDLLSVLGKLRLAADWVIPAGRGDADESLAGFVERRLGREAYERLIEPLMAGIYGGDGHSLSLLATFPQLRAGERQHGGLIRGALANRKTAAANGAAPRPGFLTPIGGTAAIADALAESAERVGVEIRTGIAVRALERTPDDSAYRLTLSDGTSIIATAVVLATPAPVSAGLLAGNGDTSAIDRSAAAILGAIPHASTVTMSLAYRAEDIRHPLDRTGYVVPRAQRRPILASTWTSSKWANRAPEGYVLLRAFAGRAGVQDATDRTDNDLIQLARTEFAEVLGITAVPQRTWVFRWPNGSPQYTVGHLDRVAEIERHIAAHPGVAIASAALRGVGLPDCVRSGERAASAVAAFLGRQER